MFFKKNRNIIKLSLFPIFDLYKFIIYILKRDIKTIFGNISFETLQMYLYKLANYQLN